MELDHIVIAGETLEAATAYVEELLGVALQPGGQHPAFGTHNRLLGLEDGLYLEAIAIDPEADDPGRPRWYDLDDFTGAPRLSNWACRTQDIAVDLAVLPEGTGEAVPVSRGDLRWQMAVPATGRLPFDNCAPALLQWEGPHHPVQRLAPSGCRMRRLIVSHPDAKALEAAVQPNLNDTRVVYETGPAGLRAEIETAAGLKVLE